MPPSGATGPGSIFALSWKRRSSLAGSRTTLRPIQIVRGGAGRSVCAALRTALQRHGVAPRDVRGRIRDVAARTTATALTASPPHRLTASPPSPPVEARCALRSAHRERRCGDATNNDGARLVRTVRWHRLRQSGCYGDTACVRECLIRCGERDERPVRRRVHLPVLPARDHRGRWSRVLWSWGYW